MTVGRIPSVEGGIQPTIFDAKADLLTATANDTPARLAVGANNTILTADSSTATGLKWAAPAGGGKVLQVVQGTTSTAVASSTTSYADMGLSATITPSTTSSKILIFYSVITQKSAGSVNNALNIRFVRGATALSPNLIGLGYSGTAVVQTFTAASQFLDSPSTTSATTYKMQFANDTNAAEVTVMSANTTAVLTLIEIGA